MVKAYDHLKSKVEIEEVKALKTKVVGLRVPEKEVKEMRKESLKLGFEGNISQLLRWCWRRYFNKKKG